MQKIGIPDTISNVKISSHNEDISYVDFCIL